MNTYSFVIICIKIFIIILNIYTDIYNASIIINTARGGIINEHDLVAAIKKNIIAGAGIDVATTEPPKKNHPYYNIIDKPNFIWTPHTAWASNTTLNNAVNQLIDNINSFYRNQPKNLV